MRCPTSPHVSIQTHRRIQLITRIHVACDPLRYIYSRSSQRGVSAQDLSTGRIQLKMNLLPQPAFPGPSAAVLPSGQQPQFVCQQFCSILWRKRGREIFSGLIFNCDAHKVKCNHQVPYFLLFFITALMSRIECICIISASCMFGTLI